MKDRACGNCAHYHQTDKDKLAGECRMNPPTVTVNVLQTYWPKVDALDWCSQFLSAENLYQKKKKK